MRLFRLTPAAALLIVLAAGVLNAFLLLGFGPINPSNTSWIFGDNGTYYSAWEQYRHDPHLHFPLAWTERVGYPVGTSIAFLDAIPIAAVVLRPFSPLLPIPFQYLGLWTVLCYALQAYFGFSLCRRLFPDSPAFAVLGTILLLLATPITSRTAGHTTLISQWLILAALDSYFRDPADRPTRWLTRFWVVAALAAGITPYLGVMCLLLAITGIAQLLVEHRVSWTRASVLLAATLAIVVASGKTFGVLASDDAMTYWAAGYGQFSWNLNSLVNPMSHGSILLPALPLAFPQQYEGYCYLGLGILALLAVDVARRPDALGWIAQRRLAPLLGLVVVSTAFAASAIVTFDSHTLFVVPLPKLIMGVLATLRGSGRFFWPVYYLIVLGVLAMTYWIWTAPRRLIILAVAIVLQIADLAPLRHEVRATLDNRFENPTKAEAWHELGRMYPNLILVPPFQCTPGRAPGTVYSYVFFGKLAAEQQMRLNSYYAARYTRKELKAHCLDILRAQMDGHLEADSAYVATDAVRTIWTLDGMTSHVCRALDGFNLCVPAAGSTQRIDDGWKLPPRAPYALDELIDFRHEKGNAPDYATFGWSDATPQGSWTEGPLAVLRLGLTTPADRVRPLLLSVNGTPFLAPSHPRLDVDVVVNGTKVGTWTYTTESAPSRQRVEIPPAIARARDGLDIEFRLRDPESPLDAGVGPAPQFVGVAVRSITVYDSAAGADR